MLRAAAGPSFFAVVTLLLFAGSYAMWPADLFSTPFAEMNPAMLLRAAAALVLGFIGLEFLAALAIVSRTDNQ